MQIQLVDDAWIIVLCRLLLAAAIAAMQMLGNITSAALPSLRLQNRDAFIVIKAFVTKQ